MNLLGGLARIFTVLHYGMAFPLAALFCVGFFEGAPGAALLCFAGLIGYYTYLERSAEVKRTLGDRFIAHPILTGISLLWTDFCVGISLAYFLILHPFVPKMYDHPTYMMFTLLIWIAPIALLFGTWNLLRWVGRGFRG
jgi:hypothetical protein